MAKTALLHCGHSVAWGEDDACSGCPYCLAELRQDLLREALKRVEKAERERDTYADALKVCIEAIDYCTDRGDLPGASWHWFNRARELVGVQES